MDQENKNRLVLWSPQPGPQTEFLARNEFEAGYGGSKGGGKTDALLFGALEQIDNPKYRAIIFRRTFPQLREIIDRSQVFRMLGAKYTGDAHRWTFPSGAILDFGHCQNEEDKQNYQGQEYHYMGFDQLEQFTETIYSFLISNIRTAIPGIKLYARSSFNPGGPGHAWVKKRFIDNKEPFKTYRNKDSITAPSGEIFDTEFESVFIPAKVWDNKILLKNNPKYLATLMQLDEKMRKALLEGNWDIYEGQYFTEWNRDHHVIRPFEIPKSWKRFRAYDHGRKNPACCLWFALDYDGRVWVYRELYVTGKDVDEIAKEINRLSEGEEYEYSVADPAIFAKMGFVDKYGGQTIAESFARAGVVFWPASNRRVDGWNIMHQYLHWNKHKVPKIIFFNTCVNAIRTIPSLVHDDHKPEDLDTRGEDHAADPVRYMLVSLHERSVQAPETAVEKKMKMINQERMELGKLYSGDYHREAIEISEN